MLFSSTTHDVEQLVHQCTRCKYALIVSGADFSSGLANCYRWRTAEVPGWWPWRRRYLRSEFVPFHTSYSSDAPTHQKYKSWSCLLRSGGDEEDGDTNPFIARYAESEDDVRFVSPRGCDFVAFERQTCLFSLLPGNTKSKLRRWLTMIGPLELFFNCSCSHARLPRTSYHWTILPFMYLSSSKFNLSWY